MAQPADETQIVDADELRSLAGDGAAPPEVVDAEPTGVDLLSLIARGGGFMIPIGLMSVLVVTLAVERLVSLRTSKILPEALVRRLGELVESERRFDPEEALKVCRERPSPAARVFGAMLMRTGQPLGEIERTGHETAQREADGLAGPIRWLNLAAAATPLMGLLGTVWGMIKAFHESTTLTPDRSRSEQLSEGIYTALVTTLAGLAVAIPAAILAQYLENRIAKLFHRIEEIAFDLAPGVGRFEGQGTLGTDGSLRLASDAVAGGRGGGQDAASRGTIDSSKGRDAAKAS
jgi:biopolymer transport protein ExbB